MTSSRACSVAVVCVVTFAAAARGEPPFGAVLWQSLAPTVQQVCVGPDGRVWQLSPPADPLAKAPALQKKLEEEFHKPTPHVQGGSPILFEPGGRVWFAGWGYGRSMITGYDGTTWIERPLQEQHVLRGRGVRIGDHLFFVDSRGIDCFDGRTWSYRRLVEPGPGGITEDHMPVVQVEPDGKSLLALTRSGTSSSLCRWRGEWTELPSPGTLSGGPLRLAPTTDGIWLFSPFHGLFFQPFDPAATVPALLAQVVAADGQTADRAAAAVATRWPTILPDVQAAEAAATDKAVIERLQRVAAELRKGNQRAVQVGPFAVRWCTNLMYLPDGTVAVAARAVTTADGGEARPGVVLARPGGRVDALFDPEIVSRMHGVTAGSSLLFQADGTLWLAGTAGPACLVDLVAGRIVATIPELANRDLQAVTPDGTVFAKTWSMGSIVAYTPGKPDTRQVLLADTTTARRGSVATEGVVVASDGAIFGVQRGRGLCGFADGEWRAVGEGDANVLGIAWSQTGSDGAVLVKFDRGFGLRVDGRWAFAADLRSLVERHRDGVARCFRRASGPAGLVADKAGNIWTLDAGRLAVLIADRWEDPALALQAVGKAVNDGLQFISGVGDGSKVYVSNLSGFGLVGEVAAGTPRFATGPVTNNRELMMLCVREPGGGLWVPATQSDPGLTKQVLGGQFPQRLTEAGVTHQVAGGGWPLLVDDDGQVWFASGAESFRLVDELIVRRDGEVTARVPFPTQARGLRLLAAGPGRVLAWTDLGLRVITAQGPRDARAYVVGPMTVVRSRDTPPRTAEPMHARPIALPGDRLAIVVPSGLSEEDQCRLFIADLPAR